ncbi:hypothetical protein ACOME3_005023 [Neoechinorhynchus agilis]
MRHLLVLLVLLLWSNLASPSIETADYAAEDTTAGKEVSENHGEDLNGEDEADLNDDGQEEDILGLELENTHSQEFNTEIDRLMKLIINSLYQNRDIFIRELISNGSDALDKLRIQSITDPNVLGETKELEIRIRIDRNAKTLSIRDTGIGMTREHLRDYLGTVARSGTFRFAKEYAEQKDKTKASEMQNQFADMIGQFGVGLYSAFLVSDKVRVVSKHNDDHEQHVWESDGKSFKVAKDPRGNTLGRGTELILQLRDDASDYLDERKLEQVIRQYSQFVVFPILLYKNSEWVRVNEVEAIWRRNPKDVKEEQYNEFYEALTGKKNDTPLAYSHFGVESEVQCTCLLFLQRKLDPMKQMSGVRENNFRLYVKRVLISNFNASTMPEYLRFVYVVVDSDDLPLNVSRETIQHSKILQVIVRKIVRKILDLLASLSSELYNSFWREYGTNIKHGLIEDGRNRLRLARLLRFYSSESPQNFTSLQNYVERMKAEQPPFIYYVSGRSVQEAESSAFAERVRTMGYEVLYLVDAIDEFALQAIPEFEGKKFQNVAKEGLLLSNTTAEDLKEVEERFEPLTRYLTDNFKEKVLSAHVSDRLVSACMVFVAAQWGYDGNMQRIAMSQAYQKVGGDVATTHFAAMKRKLEINPNHPIIQGLLERVKKDPSDPELREAARMLVQTALIRSGYEVENTKQYADKVEELVGQKMGFKEQLSEQLYRQVSWSSLNLLSTHRRSNKTLSTDLSLDDLSRPIKKEILLTRSTKRDSESKCQKKKKKDAGKKRKTKDSERQKKKKCKKESVKVAKKKDSTKKRSKKVEQVRKEPKINLKRSAKDKFRKKEQSVVLSSTAAPSRFYSLAFVRQWFRNLFVKDSVDEVEPPIRRAPTSRQLLSISSSPDSVDLVSRSVGYAYRYRISNFLKAQEKAAATGEGIESVEKDSN